MAMLAVRTTAVMAVLLHVLRETTYFVSMSNLCCNSEEAATARIAMTNALIAPVN